MLFCIYSGAVKPKYDSIFSLSPLNYKINLFSLSSFNAEIDAKLKKNNYKEGKIDVVIFLFFLIFF